MCWEGWESNPVGRCGPNRAVWKRLGRPPRPWDPWHPPRVIVQELLGHRDVRTTMIYTDVLTQGGLGVRSPMDAP